MMLDRFRQSLLTIAFATVVPTVSAAQNATSTTARTLERGQFANE